MAFPIGGGIGLASVLGEGDPQARGYLAHAIDGAANQAWDDYRPRLVTYLQDQLGRGDLVADGVTLYDIGIELAADLSLTVDRTPDGDLVVHVTTGTHTVSAHATQPTVLGSWADPAVRFSFALDFTYRLDVPPLTGPLGASGFESIHVLAPHLAPANFVADVIFVVNDIWGFLSGDDYVGLLEGFVAQTDFAAYANPALAPVNEQLTALAGEGFWFLESVVDRLDGAGGGLRTLSVPGAPSDTLDLLLTARGFDRSGVIEGEVTWPSDWGQPTTAASLSDALGDSISWTASAALLIAAPSAAPAGADPVAPAGVEHGEVLLGADHVLARAEATPSIVAERVASLPAEQVSGVVTALRAGVASQYVALVGHAAFITLQGEFLFGTTDFVVSARAHVADGTPFGSDRVVSRQAALWRADDATTGRRRYRLVDVATDTRLVVTCTAAAGYRMSGHDGALVGVSRGWTGAVTVHPPRRVTDLSTLRAHAISDRVSAVDLVALNPQPLPPVELPGRRDLLVVGDRVAVTAHGSIGAALGGGLLGDRVSDRVDVRHDASVRHLDQATLDAARTDPEGVGVVVGIDFRMQDDVPPVVR